MENPIFILGAHKSGSSLLRSLLDGHPDLFVIPLETHFFQMAHFWVDYRLRRQYPPRLPLAQIRDEYYGVVKNYNHVTNQFSDANLVGRFDLESFEKVLYGEQPETFRDLLLLYVKALHVSLLGQALAPDRSFVEKSVEHAEFAGDLLRLFPDARFLHIVRNPYANLVSLRRHIGRGRYPFLGKALDALENSYYYLYRNQRLIEKYLVVRYEDLLVYTDQTMSQVAAFLGIAFVDSLLTPSSVGQEWRGNSSRGLSFRTVSSKNLDLWRDEVTSLELSFVNHRFPFVLEDYDYHKEMPKRSLWLPTRSEGVRSYLRNRALPYS